MTKQILTREIGPLDEVESLFSGTITSIDPLGFGVIEFFQKGVRRIAIFTPEVTWYYENPKWLKPGSKVEGRLYTSEHGFKVSYLKQEGAA